MFYYLSEWREIFEAFNIFRYITFRAGMAAVTTFLICVIAGPIFIKKLRQFQVQEKARREDCPDLDRFQDAKQGTPTMGGILIIGSILISVFFWTDLSNRYILLTILTCVWLAILGFTDDYIKLIHSRDPKPAHKERRRDRIITQIKKLGLPYDLFTRRGRRGLHAQTKLIWQLLLGFCIGSFMYVDPHMSTKLDVPFLKDVVIDLGIFYIPLVILIIMGTSNAVNLTDGLDGLAIGCVLIVSSTLGVLSYITGHLKFSEYLFIPYVAGAGELTIFCAAMLGASLGFLWFNAYPATIFMGDVGSLALGGSLGIISVFIKKELLLVFLGGIFVLEAVSVILQVFSVKLRGKRIFKMSPFHHHLQMSGWSETKIIIRFWIVAIILALLTLMSLKIR
mgnify:CR=1 FL=1